LNLGFPRSGADLAILHNPMNKYSYLRFPWLKPNDYWEADTEIPEQIYHQIRFIIVLKLKVISDISLYLLFYLIFCLLFAIEI